MRKIILTGNVGKEPEVRHSKDNKEYLTFSVGTQVGYGQNKKTEWTDISCSGKLGELMKSYLKKGSKVLIEGMPSISAYINKENSAVGAMRVFADTVEILSNPSAGNADKTEPVYSLPEKSALDSDNIPF